MKHSNKNPFIKGDIVEVLAKGSLKSDVYANDFIWVEITNKSKKQVNAYLKSWQIVFEHSLIAENVDGWRYNIAVDPAYISASGQNKSQIKTGMADFITNAALDWSSIWYGVVINSWTADSITIDIPKPIQGNTAYSGNDPEWILYYETNHNDFLQELKHSFHDLFAAKTNIRRYYFKPASVDIVENTMNGEWSGTHTAALSHIVDRLSE